MNLILIEGILQQQYFSQHSKIKRCGGAMWYENSLKCNVLPVIKLFAHTVHDTAHTP